MKNLQPSLATPPPSRQPLRCMIADDEALARRAISRLAERRPELQITAQARTAPEARQMLQEGAPVDLLFLDIEMNGHNGLQMARDLERRPMIIFTTAYSTYALESYEVEAVDYLLKPVSPDRFDLAVDKALSRWAASQSLPAPHSFVVKADRRFVRINPADILFIEGLGDYLVIHLPDQRVTTRITFKALAEMLPEGEFLRTGKSYMVNLRRIESFDSISVSIAGRQIPIGHTYRDAVLHTLLET